MSVDMEHKGLIIFIVILGLIPNSLTLSTDTSESFYEVENSTEIMVRAETPSKAHLTAITWAHAVNSKQELKDALNSNIDMIEADIVLGTVNNSGDEIPVMGHPPATNSDISLKSFLQTILDFNNGTTEKKGVKLDFKSIEVFEGSVKILNDLWNLMSYPIWLNADIISGPVNNTETVAVDPKRFFAACKGFDGAVLSIGWTTKWGSDPNDGIYTNDQIQEMIDSINDNNITDSKQPITFPVRAGIAANSRKQFEKLVTCFKESNEATLTIWSSAKDYVDIKKLRMLIYSIGLDRVYIDVPEEVSSQLNLEKTTKSASLSLIINWTVIGLCLLVAKFFWFAE